MGATIGQREVCRTMNKQSTGKNGSRQVVGAISNLPEGPERPSSG
jgi:hypothetical protein